MILRLFACRAHQFKPRLRGLNHNHGYHRFARTRAYGDHISFNRDVRRAQTAPQVPNGARAAGFRLSQTPYLNLLVTTRPQDRSVGTRGATAWVDWREPR